MVVKKALNSFEQTYILCYKCSHGIQSLVYYTRPISMLLITWCHGGQGFSKYVKDPSSSDYASLGSGSVRLFLISIFSHEKIRFVTTWKNTEKIRIATFGIRARAALSSAGGGNAGGYGCNSRVLPILLSTLTSVASDLFNYALRLDNELSARLPRGRHGLWTGLKTQMGCLQIVWCSQ